MKKFVLLYLVLILAVSFGCVESNSQDSNSLSNDLSENEINSSVNSDESDLSTEGSIHNVRISTFNFIPAEITINAGDTIVWRNEDSVIHTVTSKTGIFDSGNMSLGIIFEYTFDSRGTYEYYCKPHPNMVGKVIVK